jgi:hypothetical protein
MVIFSGLDIVLLTRFLHRQCTIPRPFSIGKRTGDGQQLQVLDVDMSGLPAGRQGKGVTQGYFAGQKNRRGRQLGRVVASLYDEIVVEGLYTGRRQLDRSLDELVHSAEDVLDLTPEQRRRTLVRVDAGGGTASPLQALPLLAPPVGAFYPAVRGNRPTRRSN